MKPLAATAVWQNKMLDEETVDEAEIVVELLKNILLLQKYEDQRRPVRDKSVGHPDYPSIMPDYTGLA